jgi:hypothetical protein
MAHEPTKKIKVTAGSEIGKLVDAAWRHPVLLEKTVQSTVSHPTAVIRMICGLSMIPRKSGKQLLPMAAVGTTLTLRR